MKTTPMDVIASPSRIIRFKALHRIYLKKDDYHCFIDEDRVRTAKSRTELGQNVARYARDNDLVLEHCDKGWVARSADNREVLAIEIVGEGE